MNKIVKIVVIFLIIDIVIIAGYFAYKNVILKPSKQISEEYEWITVDEYFTPRNFVEEFIKNDSAEKGLFPVQIKNYGKNPSILKRFRGTQFAQPTQAQLNMMYRGLEDWMLVDLKFKSKEDKEIVRTILYIQLDGNWRVGDSGKLME